LKGIWVVSLIVSILILGTLSSAYALNPVFLGDFVAQTGDIIGGKTLTGVGNPSINDNGDVAFRGAFSGGSGIFSIPSVGSPSLLAELGDTIGGKTLTNIVSDPSINNNGVVAFVGAFSGGSGIFSIPSVGSPSLLAETDDIIGGKTLTILASTPSINNNGDVAFLGAFSGGFGIFTQNSLLVETGDIIGGKTLTNVGNPSINNNGDVVFLGGFSGGGGIFLIPSVGSPSLLAEADDIIGGKTLTGFGTPPSINNNGDVVFLGFFLGGSGIFTQNSLLVETGDIIGGKTLTNLNSTPSINNNGDVAIRGKFSGGSGIFSIPSVGSPSLLAELGDTIGGKTLTGVGNTLSINDNGDMAFFGAFSGGSGIIEAIKPCGAGTIQVGDKCVPDPATQISCGEGTNVENFICVITKSPRLGWDILRTFLGFN